MKKLLFISNEASMTGAPRVLVKFITYLKAERTDLNIAVFFAKNGELVEQLAQEGLDVFVSEKRGCLKSKLSIFMNRFIHYFRYMKVLIVYKPDLIYSNTIVNFGEVVLAGLARIPVILHMHEGKSFSSQYRYRLKMSCFFVSRIIVVSQYVNSILNSLTGRVGEVVYNGIDLPSTISIRKMQRGDCFKIGVLGTIDPNKGQLVAIEAIRILKDKGIQANLKIAGKVVDEKYYAELRKFVDIHSLGQVVDFVGSISDVFSFLNTLDVIVVPSFDEAFPTVILEAFSTKTLVVASDVGGIPEIIKNEINGLLFKVGDPEILADTLEKTFYDKDLLDKLPFSALKLLYEKYDSNISNGVLVNYLDNLLSRADQL